MDPDESRTKQMSTQSRAEQSGNYMHQINHHAGIISIQLNLYVKTTLRTHKIWSLYAGGLYVHVQ